MDDLVLAIVGSGGEGVVSASEILLRAAAQDGLYGMMTKSYGPQIRGGESMAQVRLSSSRAYSQGNKLDALVVLSWSNFSRFAAEIRIKDDCVVFHDSGDRPPASTSAWQNAQFVPVPFAEVSKRVAGSLHAKNIVALGYLAGWFDLSQKSMESLIEERFGEKGKDILEGNLRAFATGIDLAETSGKGTPFNATPDKQATMIISGNDAISLGALAAGVQFFAGYPITPASEIMEWMANELPKFGATFVQTEDEIAAITMTLGASFAGSKAMTATSGPGLSLMTEAIGLATMSELPVVIVDVMRAGPSTGIPTKTTQADLFHAVFGGHGDLPRVVLAPVDAADAIPVTIAAFNLAEKYQLPVMILSDQFLSQRLEVIPRPDFEELRRHVNSRTLPSADELTSYERFKLTPTGVSPITAPGIKNGMYTAAGIEHDEHGDPTSNAEIDEKMTQKRLTKLKSIQREEVHMLVRAGDDRAELGILAWGSSTGVIREAMATLAKEGYQIAGMFPRQLVPLPVSQIQTFMNKRKRLLIVELSQGQFHTYLKGQLNLPEKTKVFKRSGATPFTIQEIIEAIQEVEERWKKSVPETTVAN